MKRSLKYILLFAPVLLIAVILTAVFWDTLLLRIAPKAVLTTAMSKALSQLDVRFKEDPLHILLPSIDPDGKYTADISLQTSSSFLGDLRYDMIVQSNLRNHQLQADGTIASSSQNLDISLYADQNFMAVSSETLVNNCYYGITYESFVSDIRSIPLLNFLISESQTNQWNSDIQKIRQYISREYPLLAIPDISEEEARGLLFAVAALPCEIEQRSFTERRGIQYQCDVLTYPISNDQIDSIVPDWNITDAEAAFYLYNNSLINVQLSWTNQEQNKQFSLYLGENPALEPLHVQYTSSPGDQYSCWISTGHDGNNYTQTLEFLQYDSSGVAQENAISFHWDPSGGSLILSIHDSGPQIRLILKQTENGLYLQTEDFAELTSLLIGDEVITAPASCSLTLEKGSNISIPVYKNLNQWSLEDFLGLLENLGAMIGIELGFL